MERLRTERCPEGSLFNPKTRQLVLAVSGAVSGALVFMGADRAYADQPSPDPSDTTDHIHIDDADDTVWGNMTGLGYTPQEITADLRAHGVPQSEWATLRLQMGTRWDISPNVQASRASRLGGSVIVTLADGDTIWSEALEQGVDEQNIPELVRWIEDIEGEAMPPANELPIGFTFTIPAHLLQARATLEIVPPSGLAGVVVLGPGSTIIHELEVAGVDNPPMEVVQQVLDANGLSVEDATNLKPGTVVVVPGGILPETYISPAGPVPPADSPDVAESPINIDTNPTAESVAPPQPESTQDISPPSPVVETPIALSAISDVTTQLRETYATGGTDVSMLGELLSQTLQHPELNEHLGITADNVSQLFIFPERQRGFDFVINPQTCNAELVVSAPMLAFVVAVQDYARWLTENDSRFIQYRGLEFDIGDFNSGQHRTHQYGLAIDLRSRFPNMPAELYPDGPLFMSGADGFDLVFTEAVYSFARTITYNGESMLDLVITGSNEAEGDLTGGHNKGDWVAYDDAHGDHSHINLREIFTVTGFFSHAVPISCDDPETGGRSQFEEPISDETWPPPVGEVPVSTEYPAPEEPAPESTATTTEPDSYWQLHPSSAQTISELNLEQYKKDFVSKVTDIVMRAYNNGAQINPRVVIAQAVLESGFGMGKGAIEGNNIFSVKASDEYIAEHPDKIVWIYDDEYDANGERKLSAFKKYDSVEEALLDYIRMITEADHYNDAQQCRGSDDAYINGLMNELRIDCTIGRMKGEDGVMSYATNDHYAETLLSVIRNLHMDGIIMLNPDEQERLLTLEWADLHAA